MGIERKKLRCFHCGHVRNAMAPWGECPKCRKHQAVDDVLFQECVAQVSRMLRCIKPETALDDFAAIMDQAEQMSHKLWTGWESGAVTYQIVTTALQNLGYGRNISV